MTNYEKQANDFLHKNKIECEIVFSHTGKHFSGDTEERDIYSATFKKGDKKQFSIVFGASINDTRKRALAKGGWGFDSRGGTLFLSTEKRRLLLKEATPTAYSILACLQKYEVGDLDDFLSEYGYEVKKAGDLRRLQKLHIAVYEEWDKVRGFFSSKELEELRNIN